MSDLPVLRVVPTGKVETNFNEIKAFVTGKIKHYSDLVYTEDQIPDAKKDRAELNKLSAALNRARIDSKKAYMEPFSQFEEEAKQLKAAVDAASNRIGVQIKAYDEQQQREKRAAIEKMFAEKAFPEGIVLSHIFDPKWLNKKPDLEDISLLMDGKLVNINNDLHTLDTLLEYREESREVYFQRLDLNVAMRFHEERVRWDREEQLRREEEEARRRQEELLRQQEVLERQRQELEQQKEALRQQNTAAVNIPAAVEPKSDPPQAGQAPQPAQDKDSRQWMWICVCVNREDKADLLDYLSAMEIPFTFEEG